MLTSDFLSTELWTRVFVQLSHNQWRPVTTRGEGLTRGDVDQYPHLHQLKLVCKKFKDAFQEHHDLFSVLLLRKGIGTEALPGLLAWLQRHSTDVSVLLSSCGPPCTDAALAFLTSADKLTKADLLLSTASTVQILSMCTSLATCVLRGHAENFLNVASLKNLQKLVKLELYSGTFTHVLLTSSLTSLVLTQAEVWVDAVDKDTCGLKQIALTKSEVYGLEEGICTFACLCGLRCRRSNVHTPNDACKLSIGVQGCHVDLSGLTALTQPADLELNVGRSSYPSLEPIHALRSLMYLNLVGADSVHVTAGLSSLCNLTALAVTGMGAPGGVRVQAKLAVQWSYMPALQNLHVRNVDFSTDDMALLISWNNLKVADFSSSQPSDLVSMKHFAELIYCLGSKRPDVKFKC